MATRSRRRGGKRGWTPAFEPIEARIALSVTTPSFVADINTRPAGGQPGLGPADSVLFNSATLTGPSGETLVVFSARDGAHGRELWVTDGTSAGTTRIADLWPGPAEGAPTDLAACGDAIYFAASDGGHGRELWRTDGTPSGTRLVKDLFVGGDSEPSGFRSLPDGTVLFTATAEVSGASAPVRGLWRTDGTASGTLPVRPADEPGAVSPGPLTVFGTIALFAAEDPVAPGSRVLWSTDGTAAHTAPLVVANAALEDPRDFVIFEGAGVQTPSVLFTTAAAGGRQLWRYETGGEPVLVAQFTGDVTDLTRYGNDAFFSALGPAGSPELWRTDGTAAGTAPLRRRENSVLTPILEAGSFTVVDHALFFKAAFMGGTALWRSLGSDTSTAPVGPIDPSADGFVGSGGRIYFANFDGQSREVWVSDGTAIGILREIHPFGDAIAAGGTLSAAPLAGGLLFAADDGVIGTELWATDGTAAGTALVRDLDPATADGLDVGADVGTRIDGVVIDDVLYFTADDGQSGAELWKREGDAAPSLVADLVPGPEGSCPGQFTVAGDRLFFTTIDSGPAITSVAGNASFSLWVLDASVPAARPRLLKEGVVSSGSRDGTTTPVAFLMPVGDAVVFAADDGNGDIEPWITDGSAGPGHTRLLLDINPTGASLPAGFAATDSRVVFTADDGEGRELWVTDGTPGGTTLVMRIQNQAGMGSLPANLATVGSLVYFSADDGQHGREPWVTDGSSAGTRLVRDINPLPGAGSDPYGFVSTGGVVVFAANDGMTGMEPWVTDGTAGQTRLLVDLHPGPAAGSRPLRLAQAAGKVFFSADDGGGSVPWVTDGTAAGTEKLSLGGFADPDPDAATFLPLGDRVYFTALASGRRSLFSTDGTGADTTVVVLGNGLSNGFTGSRAVALASAPGRLYFAIDDGVHGEELWQIDASPGIDPAPVLAVGSDGNAGKWDREFAYSVVDGTRIRIDGLTATQSGFFSRGMPLSLLPAGAVAPLPVSVEGRVYDARRRSVVVTLAGPLPPSGPVGTLVVGVASVPGARLIDAENGSTLLEIDAPALVAAGYAPAFAARFQGGLRVAAGDVDGDAFPDLAVVPGGVPTVGDPLAPGTLMSTTFAGSHHRATVFLASGGGVASISIDVNADGRFGTAADGYVVAVGDVLADGAGSGTKELVVASGNRVAVFDMLVGPQGEPSFSSAAPRGVDLRLGERITAVAVGRFFAGDGAEDLVVASSTATARAAGTTTIWIFDSETLQLRRSFPVAAFVQSGPGRKAVNVFGFGASLAVGDIDGDSSHDLVIGSGANGLGNFRVLGNAVITSSAAVTSPSAYRAAIAAQLGPQGAFAWQRAPGPSWKPSGGPDYFMPLDVPGPLGRGFNAPLSVATATGRDGRARVFAAIGAGNTTGNEVRRFQFTGLGGQTERWTGETAFAALPSAGGMRFRLGGGLRLGG